MSQPPSSLNEQFLDAAVELMGRSGRRGTVRVEGRSMRPILDSDDVVAIDFESRPPRFGDLLLFRQLDYLVIHRAVGNARRRPDARGPRYRTRGDSVSRLDPVVVPERIVGRAVAIYDGKEWWDLDRLGARLYAWEIALHDLFWAGAGAIARRGDRGLKRIGIRALIEPMVAWVDRTSLRLVHPLIFWLSHRRVKDRADLDAMLG
ncbi:MAG: S26 family signal peptidase [Acidobacteriota bacterium]|nr:S26 family signal peptidase [Acidobacteriota bacterium]